MGVSLSHTCAHTCKIIKHFTALSLNKNNHEMRREEKSNMVSTHLWWLTP